jgi:hypothetical protein
VEHPDFSGGSIRQLAEEGLKLYHPEICLQLLFVNNRNPSSASWRIVPFSKGDIREVRSFSHLLLLAINQTLYFQIISNRHANSRTALIFPF